jgi:hypothetical protein
MQTVSIARRPAATIPIIFMILVAAALALLAESQLKLPLRFPGHRAFYGALALGLLVGTPRAALAVFAAVVGTAVAVLAGNPLMALMWFAPAALLTIVRPRTRVVAAALVIAAGVAFGLLRYLSLTGLPHHTPELVRLGGHVGFGALGAVLARLGGRFFDGRHR